MLSLALTASAAGGTKHEGAEMRNQWAGAKLLGDKAKLPFSFGRDGPPSEKLLPAWRKKSAL
jgi:hypothetical protein